MEKFYILLALPLFIIFWCLITGLISLLSGWSYLAKQNPVPGGLYEKGQTYGFQSIKIGYMGNYNMCINITLYQRGICLNPIVLYRFMHKPIFIAWEKMKDAEEKNFIMDYITFTLDNKRIKIFGKSLAAIKERMKTGPQIPGQSPTF